jgi:hypothetical protein
MSITEGLLFLSFLIIVPVVYIYCSINFEERGIEADILDKVGFAATGFCVWVGVALLCAFLKVAALAVWTAATL